MSARIFAAAVISLGALLVPPPLPAREMMNHDAMVGHSGFALPGRSVIGPHLGSRDRRHGDRRHSDRFGRALPFGSIGLLGLDDGTVDIGSLRVEIVAAGEPRSAAAPPADHLPPCQETTSAGVVVARGMACSHAAR